MIEIELIRMGHLDIVSQDIEIVIVRRIVNVRIIFERKYRKQNRNFILLIQSFEQQIQLSEELLKILLITMTTNQ